MSTIVLKSGLMKITKIVKKSQAGMFKNLKVGDIIECSVDVAYAGRNGGSHATYMDVRNVQTGEKTSKSFNQLPSILSQFEFEPTF